MGAWLPRPRALTRPPSTLAPPFGRSYVCSNTDPSAWGPEPLKFDPYGHAPKLWGPNAIFNGFNSVGDHGERICPGRALALEMAIDFLQAIHAQK